GPAPASKEPPPRAGPLRGPPGAPPALGCRPWARQAPPGTSPEGPRLAPSFAAYWLPEGGRLPKGRTRAEAPWTRPEGAGGSTVRVQPVKDLDMLAEELDRRLKGTLCVVNLRHGQDELAQVRLEVEQIYVDDRVPTTRTLRVLGRIPDGPD